MSRFTSLPEDGWHWSLTEHTFQVFLAAYRRIGEPAALHDKQLASLCSFMIGASMPQTWVVT